MGDTTIEKWKVVNWGWARGLGRDSGHGWASGTPCKVVFRTEWWLQRQALYHN